MNLFRSAAYQTHIESLMKQWNTPGLAVALVQDQEIVSQGFGKATLNPPKLCTSDTVFEIASSSKSLTASAVAILVRDDSHKEVQWDAKMSDLLPDDFAMSNDSYTKDVTVEDILSHRSGLPSHDTSYLSTRAAHPDTPQSVTRNVRNLVITEPIRTKYQ